MDHDSRAGSAIIPGDENRQLALPEEMVRRGLELAARIEQRQGIEPYPPKPAIKEYTLRCYMTIINCTPEEVLSLRISENDESKSRRPVYALCSISKDGLHISCASADKNLSFPAIDGNEDRYPSLTAFNNLEPFTIPYTSFGLCYKLYHPVQNNMKIVFSPTGLRGYIGPVKANPNFHMDRDCVEIDILYISMLGDPNLKQGLVRKDPPLILEFVVIDQKDQDDPAATFELYHALLEAKNSPAAK